jgi:hypothetical protein
MKITADDWHFRPSSDGMLVVDVFLSNGQHAVLEVCPMHKRDVPNGDVPEMIVFCEFPGEKLTDGNCAARWIARPPSKSCPWSSVGLPPALAQQVREKLGYAPSLGVASAAA